MISNFSEEATFTLEGGSNSTVSDILVETVGGKKFYIEVKQPQSQSGQFVLLPNIHDKKFVFSSLNKTKPNEATNTIIEHMNNSFESFSKAGTGGRSLDIDSKVFDQWVMDYYTSKGVKYFITKGVDYIIFPTNKLASYYDVTAKYRVKRSGSSQPSSKYRSLVISELSSNYGAGNVVTEGSRVFLKNVVKNVDKTRFQLGDYEYYFASKNDGYYEVRQLSKTFNMNVIFGMSLKREQNLVDLIKFKTELSS